MAIKMYKIDEQELDGITTYTSEEKPGSTAVEFTEEFIIKEFERIGQKDGQKCEINHNLFMHALVEAAYGKEISCAAKTVEVKNMLLAMDSYSRSVKGR